MLIYALVISILLPALGETKLEVCVCCGEEIGQSVSKSCEIPAKSLSEKELAAILELCEERKVQSYYESVPNLSYITLNKSIVDYPVFPSKDCATILNDRWFWMPDDNPWLKAKGNGQLARKVLSSNYTDQHIYELLTYNDYRPVHIYLASNPSLGAFNGTYEFLLRAVPQQTLHDIEFREERKIWRNEIVNLGETHLYSDRLLPDSFTNHAWVPRYLYYNINANLTKGSMLDVQDENDTIYFRVGGDKQDSVIKSMTVPEVKFPPGWVLTYTVRGKWVDTEHKFTAKLRSTYSSENSENIFLTTEDIVTGSKFESTIELIEGDYIYSWYGTLMVSDKAMAGILFTIAGLMILAIIFVCIKKVCCCCFRDTVTTGYQRIDETIPTVPT